MNRLSKITISALFLGFTGAAFSATSPTSSSTPFVNPHPHTHQVNQTLRQQWQEIQKGVQSGKLSKSQGDTLRATLKSIRQQEEGFFKTNGNKELTVDQQTQLNQLLSQNQQTLTAAGLTPAAH